MISIVVVFPKREVLIKFKNLLVKNGFDVAAACTTGGQALQAIEELEGGVLISGIRFPDMMYSEMMEYLPKHFEMIVIASDRQWQQYAEEGVYHLGMPLRGFDLIDLAQELMAGVAHKLKSEKSMPKKRSQAQQNVIDRAKELLMKEYDYSEMEAHRFLQKRSMDTGNNIVDVAYMVLDIYS